MIDVHLYGKSACCLCEEMEQALAGFVNQQIGADNTRTAHQSRPQWRLVRCDIEEDPHWFDKYAEIIPLLEIGGVEVCRYFFDAQRFSTHLANALASEHSCDNQPATG